MPETRIVKTVLYKLRFELIVMSIGVCVLTTVLIQYFDIFDPSCF